MSAYRRKGNGAVFVLKRNIHRQLAGLVRSNRIFLYEIILSDYLHIFSRFVNSPSETVVQHPHKYTTACDAKIMNIHDFDLIELRERWSVIVRLRKRKLSREKELAAGAGPSA